jgi:pimeloyl-ACP methyl ester carboxylesterase
MVRDVGGHGVGLPAAHWVFLHGTPLTPEVWWPIADRFRDGSTTVSCPSLDARGSSAEHAARIAADLPPDGRVYLVGHSFGGQVAIDLAVALGRQHRLAGLGVICSRATPFPPFEATAEALRSGRAPDIEASLERWFTPAERNAGSPVVDYARQRLRDADPAVWADALQSIARFDRVRELAAVSAPTVLIAAEDDAVSPPEVMEAMAVRLPRAEFHVLRGTAHMGPFLHPDVVIGLLRDGMAG